MGKQPDFFVCPICYHWLELRILACPTADFAGDPAFREHQRQESRGHHTVGDDATVHESTKNDHGNSPHYQAPAKLEVKINGQTEGDISGTNAGEGSLKVTPSTLANLDATSPRRPLSKRQADARARLLEFTPI